MDTTRRIQILDAYKGHARRFDKIAARRRAGGTQLRPRSPAESETDIEGLSERQLEVLELVAGGLSNSEICRQLDVTLETVKTHIIHILQRLHARSRAHAVGIGYKHGLLA
jgi:ATP/maltotriose-dependent transcriptional regulator MalT